MYKDSAGHVLPELLLLWLDLPIIYLLFESMMGMKAGLQDMIYSQMTLSFL